MDKAEFDRIASLSGLSFDDGSEFMNAFDEIVAFADELDKAVCQEGRNVSDGYSDTEKLRDDIMGKSLDAGELLENTEERDGYFISAAPGWTEY